MDVIGDVLKQLDEIWKRSLASTLRCQGTVFRNWTTIDRGHFAESVVRKMREGHLERHPERGVSLAIVDWPLWFLFNLLCGRSFH